MESPNTIDEFYARPDQDIPVYIVPPKTQTEENSEQEDDNSDNKTSGDTNINKSKCQSYENNLSAGNNLIDARNPKWEKSPYVEIESNYHRERHEPKDSRDNNVKDNISYEDKRFDLIYEKPVRRSLRNPMGFVQEKQYKQHKYANKPETQKFAHFAPDPFMIQHTAQPVYDRRSSSPQGSNMARNPIQNSKGIQDKLQETGFSSEDKFRQLVLPTPIEQTIIRSLGSLSFNQFRRRLNQLSAGLLTMVLYFLILYVGLIFIVIVTNRPMVFKPFFRDDVKQ